MTKSVFEKLKFLREELVEAYTKSTHLNINLEDTRKSADDANINAILADMKRIFEDNPDVVGEDFLKTEKDILDYRTLYKVLRPDKADSDISPRSQKNINNYLFLIRRKSGRKQDAPSIVYKGAYLIDDNFKQAKRNVNGLELIKFYTYKLISDIQWGGVFNGYDIRHHITDKLKTVAFQSYGNKSSKVCAVVLGDSGSGKSTVLRRFAAESISNSKLNTIWIYNINEFNKSFTDIGNNDQEYLLIIDDWNSVESSPDAKWTFLNNLREFHNVRVVIGDYYARADYEELCYGDNFYNLGDNDNKEILKKIVSKIWPENDAYSDFFKLPDSLFKAPLYMILFVMFNTYSLDMPIKLDFEDFQSQFKKIIKNDLNEINKEYPGFIRALYYWSHIYKKYNEIFTWQGLLKLANFYQSDTKSTNDLLRFSNKSRICNLISHYISLEQFVNPLLDDQHLITFNHDLLVEALSQSPNRDLYFDDDITVNVVEALIDCDELLIAKDWYRSFISKQTFEHTVFRDKEKEAIRLKKLDEFTRDKRHQKINEKLQHVKGSFFSEIWQNEITKDYFENIETVSDMEWLVRFYWIYLRYKKDGYLIVMKVLKKILDRLLAMGCTSKFIKRVSELSKTPEGFSILIDDITYANLTGDLEQLDYLNGNFGSD